MRALGHRRAWAATAVVAALALSGCGGDDGDGDSDDPVDTSSQLTDPAVTDDATDESTDGGASVPSDACELITPDEVAGVLQTANPDESEFSVTTINEVLGEQAHCAYSWTSDFSEGQFDLYVFPESLYFDPGTEQVPLEGIGDEAFEQDDNYYAAVGDLMVNIVNVQQTEQASIDLLEIAAERLGG